MPASSHAQFILDSFEASYVETHRRGGLAARAEAAEGLLHHCHVCPRACGVDRLEAEDGVCGSGRFAVVASAFAHHGEESCLSGSRGSGTIFFSPCNLRCVFCQNWELSHFREGTELSAPALAAVMLELQQRGCHNVNFVTPTHVVPQILEALTIAVPAGLHLPLVYNSSGYDSVETLQLLEGVVDVYMPDFKFWKAETGARLAAAPDYPERARAALTEMQRQAGVLRFGADGLARRGVLVRHLVMPGQGEESAAIFAWLTRELSPDTYVNVMGQYRPAHLVGQRGEKGSRGFDDIARRPTRREMEAAFEAARAAGLWRLDGRAM